jgi:hypothetical protein
MFIHKPETITASTDHETHLPLRQAVLDQEIYYVIKQTYKRLGYTGLKKTYKAVRLNAYRINREKCKWFTDHCRRHKLNQPNRDKASLYPIKSNSINKRCYIDLIDMRAGFSGLYN